MGHSEIRRGWLMAAGVASLAALLPPSRAEAQESGAEPAVKWGLSYTADLIGASLDGRKDSGRYLDDLQFGADFDLDALAGWRGMRASFTVMSNSGGAPNDIAATLQGIDNIEVARPRAKLYEAWIEADLGAVQALAGLYDLNADFYSNESAGLLIAPAFGIGSELAATGPNGPSIFPSTSPAVRVNWAINDDFYARAAVLNAKAGVLGDPGGVDISFDDGALVAAETGWTGEGKIAFGAWRYTERQDDIRDLDVFGDPESRIAQGAYVLAEHPIGGKATAFARLGIADGDTTPYVGGWQAGALIEAPLAFRPQGALSVGVNQGFTNSKFRANGVDAGEAIGRAESAIEITYADKLGEHVTIQPDLQWVRRPGADQTRKDAWVAGLRVAISFGPR